MNPVQDTATRLRTALEQGGLRLRSLRNFPKGSCGDTSEMLGQYLSDSGLGTWSYRCGIERDLFVSHARVERSGLIVDITADQFAYISERVIATTDRTWHDARFSSGQAVRLPALNGLRETITGPMRWRTTRHSSGEQMHSTGHRACMTVAIEYYVPIAEHFPSRSFGFSAIGGRECLPI